MDGQTTELAANVIAQNMFAQCDSEGNQYLLLAGIVDHRKDTSAVEKDRIRCMLNADPTFNYERLQKGGACAWNGRMGVHPSNALRI